MVVKKLFNRIKEIFFLIIFVLLIEVKERYDNGYYIHFETEKKDTSKK